VPFGAASAYTNLAANDGTADIFVSSGGATQFELVDQTLLSGGVYTMFLLGDESIIINGTTGILSLDRAAIAVTAPPPPASGAAQ
jgi:hypothetical protein